MSHWRSTTFWASAVFGWFVTMILLAVMVALFGAEEMTRTEGITANIAIQVLSLAAGYAHGRRQVEMRESTQRGFPIIPKNDRDPPAG